VELTSGKVPLEKTLESVGQQLYTTAKGAEAGDGTGAH
jgi:hypothetical protein